jgi:hypothetical protein
VILLHQHLDWRLNVHIQNNKPLVYQRSVIAAMAGYGKFLGCNFSFVCRSQGKHKHEPSLSLDFKL